MFLLYERVEKEGTNYYGIKKPKGNPFLEGPCLLCFAAQKRIDYNVGILREGTRFARVRVRGDNASGVLVQDSSVSFCTFDREKDKIEDLYREYILPILESVKDKKKLCKVFRNINLISYCDARIEIDRLIDLIASKLSEMGNSPEDVQDILKNISCVSVGTPHEVDDRITSFTFLDVLDGEGVSSGMKPLPSEFVEALKTSKNKDQATIYHKEGTNGTLVFNAVDGEHTPEYMTKKGDVMRACVPTVVTAILENSIRNSRTQELVPIDSEEIVEKLNTVVQDITEGRTTADEIVSGLDQTVYSDDKRSSDTKLRLTSVLDTVASKLVKVELKDISAIRQEERTKWNTFFEGLKRGLTYEQLDYIVHGEGEPRTCPKTKLSAEADRTIREVMEDFFFDKSRVSGPNSIDYPRRKKRDDPNKDTIENVLGLIDSKKVRDVMSKIILDRADLPKTGDPSLINSPEIDVDSRVTIEKILGMIDLKYKELEVYNKNLEEFNHECDYFHQIIRRVLEVVPSHVLAKEVEKLEPNIIEQYAELDEDPYLSGDKAEEEKEV
jgi:hypothetical protein